MSLYYQSLSQLSLSPNQHYILHCCSTKCMCQLLSEEEIMKEVPGMISRGLLIQGPDNVYPSTTGKEILDKLEGYFRKIKNTKSPTVLGENYIDKIKEFQDKFPSGKKSTPVEIQSKLINLLSMDTTITWQEIMKATDIYFSEFREEKFIMKAGNFIMVQRGGTNTYTLLEYIERVREGDSSEAPGIQMYNIS